ncbi:hypothetical protein KP509_38G015700 [Ceratopteris richardii]|uniref:Rrn7/TAF1B N-terminal cyclin domain-containing protein n=1 Tax=Ceratopteris richardii TaxID=49495 RepID=A0A8T2Q3B4_CERRI|nr:hypothetical protein KP509_38G015700 [Ceratopteris richardii]
MALFSLCNICGADDLQGGDDGYFYCSACGSQSQQYQEQLLDFEAMAGYTKRTRRTCTAPEEVAGDVAIADDEALPHLPSSQNALFSRLGFGDSSNLWENIPSEWATGNLNANQPPQSTDPMETMDADAHTIRTLYIEGLQHIMQLQCETLVQDFKASPYICGVFGAIWLRFVAFTRVLENNWAREAIQIEDARGKKRTKPHRKKKRKDLSAGEQGGEDGTVQMKMKLCYVWLKALKERIPLASSLAIVYLACHVMGEAILPTDLVQWACKGNLPYLAAFSEVEKKKKGSAWPIEAKAVFRPVDVLGARKLEFMAASIAKCIGLQLSPVNFIAISHRLLKDLNLPIQKLSIYLHKFYEWYRPPGLNLSTEPHALPTRVYVMAMILIILKIFYKVDGCFCGGIIQLAHGEEVGPSSHRNRVDDPVSQETNHTINETSSHDCGTHGDDDNIQKSVQTSTDKYCNEQSADDEWNIHFLLKRLEKSWVNHSIEPFDCKKDLSSYLKYCRDIVFPGLKLEVEEENMCERLWKLYEQPSKKDDAFLQRPQVQTEIPEVQSLSEDSHFSFSNFNAKRFHKEEELEETAEPCTFKVDNDPEAVFENGEHSEKITTASSGSLSLEETVHDMDSLGFTCLPPRKKSLKSYQYLRYVRKRSKTGNAQQIVHADYFMVLCACSSVIKVHPIALHWCVQRVEKSLLAIEEKTKNLSSFSS